MTSKQMYFLGKVLLASLFIISGLLKLFNFSGTVQYMEGLGLPFASWIAMLVIAIEFLGGLALLAGWNIPGVAGLLMLFVAAATLIAHRFWEPGAGNHLPHFLKNIAIIGALLMLWAMEKHGCPWKKHQEH